MANELKKLSRIELLELLLAQQEEFEELEKKLKDNDLLIEALRKQIEDLQNNVSVTNFDDKILEEKFKEYYTKEIDEIKALRERSIRKSEALLSATKEKCRDLIIDTKKKCAEMKNDIKGK